MLTDWKSNDVPQAVALLASASQEVSFRREQGGRGGEEVK
jgi:hypothetical protein